MLLATLFIPFLCLGRAVHATAFSCSIADPACLNSFFNDSSILNTFLGNHDEVVFQNDVLKSGSVCAAMTVLFARGTSEPGNVGIVTGPPFFSAIAEYLNGTGRLALQGVDYPANIFGFLAGGSSTGATQMASLINSTLAACPSTLLTVSGYSQGAEVVHLAMSQLPTKTTSRIASVVLFGDPKNGTALNGVDARRVMTICHSEDDICKGGDDIGLAHLNYSSDAGTAAIFALSGVARLGITSQRIETRVGV